MLTVQSFAWSTAGREQAEGAARQLDRARRTSPQTIATTIRDRGADGVNLDFEPIASGYDEEFTCSSGRPGGARQGPQGLPADVRYDRLHRQLPDRGGDRGRRRGRDLRSWATTTGRPTRATAGSIAPLRRTGIDIIETIDAYTARVPASKLILGVPYYGRAWSTVSDVLRAATTDAVRASSSVTYANAVDYLADHGRRYDATEEVAWTAYRDSATARHGASSTSMTPRRSRPSTTSSTTTACAASGIWALGYDGARTELWKAIRERVHQRHDSPARRHQDPRRPPSRPRRSRCLGVDGRLRRRFARCRRGSIDGGSWARWLSGTTATSATYVGARGHAFAFRVRARDLKGNVSSWTGVPSSAHGEGRRRRVRSGRDRHAQRAIWPRGPATPSSTTLSTGDLVAFLEGPVTADGYTWYRVAAPLTEWSVVGSPGPTCGSPPATRARPTSAPVVPAEHDQGRHRRRTGLHGRCRVVPGQPGPPARHAQRPTACRARSSTRRSGPSS